MVAAVGGIFLFDVFWVFRVVISSTQVRCPSCKVGGPARPNQARHEKPDSMRSALCLTLCRVVSLPRSGRVIASPNYAETRACAVEVVPSPDVRFRNEMAKLWLHLNRKSRLQLTRLHPVTCHYCGGSNLFFCICGERGAL